jgi:hypothetical protein
MFYHPDIDYGINAEQMAARLAAQQQGQAPASPQGQQQAQAGAGGVFGGFFNKMVSAVQTAAQTAAATLTFTDQPKEVEQEELIWALEFTGKKVDGGPWRKTFKIVWILSLITVGVRNRTFFTPLLLVYKLTRYSFVLCVDAVGLCYSWSRRYDCRLSEPWKIGLFPLCCVGDARLGSIQVLYPLLPRIDLKASDAPISSLVSPILFVE